MSNSLLKAIQEQIRTLTFRPARKRRRSRSISTEQLETRHMLSAVVELVADINQAPAGIERFNGSAQVEINGITFFMASTLDYGDELWRTDGTPVGTYRLTDILPGPQDSQIFSMTRVGELLLLVARDRNQRDQLWRSDGTVSGTKIVSDSGSINSGSPIREITSFGDTAAFSTDGQTGELWMTDGTSSGTARFYSLPFSERIGTISAVSGGRFYFSTYQYSAQLWNNDWSLWTSDGTPTGTQRLRSFGAGFGLVRPEFTLADGQLFMLVYNQLDKTEVWVSDGTPTGTLPLSELSADVIPLEASRLTVVENNLFFVATPEPVSRALWAYNIDDHSVTRLTGEPEVIEYWYSSGAVEYAGSLYFDHSGELWKSDGTRAGTMSISNPASVSFTSVRAMKNTLLLIGNDLEHGAEFWTSDGTSDGTRLLKDIFPGFGSSQTPYEAYGVPQPHRGAYAVFIADDGILGKELWGTDGTPSGTQRLAELAPGTTGSYQASIVDADGELLFLAGGLQNNVSVGPLWSTDSATHAIIDHGFATRIGVFNGTVYYLGHSTDGRRQVPYQWNGTEGELVPGVPSELDGVSPPFRLAGSDYFFGYVDDQPAGFRAQLRKSTDGNGESIIVKEFPYILNDQFFVHNELLYFLAPNGFGLFNLWRSNGTAAGTFAVSESPLYATAEQYQQFVALQGHVFVDNPAGFFVTDGSAEGTHAVRDIVPGFTLIRPIKPLRDSYLVYGNSVDHGSSLWKTDGTADGTVLLKAGVMVDQSASAATSDNVFFFGYSEVTDFRTALWKSDGTTSGTQIVYAFDKWFRGGDVQNLRVVGNKVIFTILEGETGHRTLWVSDGTSEGTVQLNHNLEGQLVLNENAQFTLYNDGIAFVAATDEVGLELFRIDTTINVTAPTGLTVTNHGEVVDLTWPDVAGAIQYDVWMQNLSDLSAPVIRKRINDSRLTLLDDTGYMIADDLSSSVYRVWVRSLPVLGETSAWSVPKDFVLGPDPVMHEMPAISTNAIPTFRWTGPQDVVSYELWLSNRDMKTRPIYRPGLQSTSFAVTDPLPPAKYAVWVRGTRADGTTTDWSAVTEFEILALPVQLTSGKGDSRTPRPTFMWAAVTDATGYDVRVFAAGTTTLIYSANNVNGLTHTPLQDLPAGKFTVYVRALKGTRPLSAWGNGDALWLKLPPLNLRSTATGVAWDAVPFAVSYTFELRDSRGALAVPRKSQTGTTFDPATPLTPGQYSLRVFTNFSNLSSNWSATYAFELFRPPVAITSSGAATVDATPTITWTAAPGAATYVVVVTKPGSAVPVYARTGITTTSHRIDIPLGNGIHEIQVRAIFADGSRSSWSPVQQLFIGPAPTLTYAAGKLSWSSVNAATNYELWINYLGLPNQARIVYQPLYAGTSYTLPSTLPKGRYQTWLRAIRAENGQLYAGAWTSVLFDVA